MRRVSVPEYLLILGRGAHSGYFGLKAMRQVFDPPLWKITSAAAQLGSFASGVAHIALVSF